MSGVRKLIITIAAVATAMSMAMPGQADIIYSNIQPGDNFGPGVAIGVVPFVGVFNYAGEGFIPTQNYNFDSVEMAASLFSGPNILDVYLMGTVGGLPTGILESFTLSNDLSNNPATGMVTIDSLSHPLLEAGMEYWVVAAGGPTTTVFWAQNVHNIMGPNVSGPTLSTLVLDSSSNVIMAMQVDGIAVPEPASWTLLLGVLGLAGVYVTLSKCRGRSIF
jgi:hypothetical protein